MKDIMKVSEELNKMILESDVYTMYIKAKEKLMERPELLDSMRRFRQRSYDIQENSNIDNPFDEINNLSREYDEVVHDTIVSEYIRAEQRFCKMMNRMYETIAADIDVEL